MSRERRRSQFTTYAGAALAAGVAAIACGACSSTTAANGRAGAKNDGNAGAGAGGSSGGDNGGAGGSGGFAPTNDAGFTTRPMPTSDGATGMSGLPPPTMIDECLPGNAANLDAATVQSLEAGSGGAGNMRWLYPYDGTVFPRGLLAPLLMWDGGPTPDAVYVHIHASSFDYKGCLKPTGTGQLQLGQPAWEGMGANTHGPGDPFTIELTLLSGGQVTGPLSEQVVVAPATLKGSIYYNSYSSKLAQMSGGGLLNGGAVLRIQPGAQAQVFLGQSGCTGCHSVSANGSRLLAATFPLLGVVGNSYALTPNVAPNPTPMVTPTNGAAFSGVYPDGSLYVATGNVNNIGPRNGGPGSVPATAGLYDTATGNAITNSNIPSGALAPTFSPDGTLLTFNDYAINNGHGLAIMDFSAANKAASNYRQVYADSGHYPAWPFFLADDKGIVFAESSTGDFTGSGVGIAAVGGIGAGIGGAQSDIYVLDIASQQPTLLAQAMGYRTVQDAQGNTTYLPFGASELHQNFYPTTSPIAAGGYFWIFFDSVRNYGNMGSGRQLWGTALQVSADGTYTADPSHPAFYIPGQEFGTGNHRAFTALDPCHGDGTTCNSGVDCCGGYCTDGMCGIPQMPRCSNTDETCKTADDCCNKAEYCLGGFCGTVIPK